MNLRLMQTAWARHADLGVIFLVGFGSMLLEVLLTRVAAVTLFANLAFGVIALSMLGLAIGSGLAAREKSLSGGRRRRRLAGALLVGAFFSLVAAGLATKLPLIPDQLFRGNELAGSFLQRRWAFENSPSQAHWIFIAVVCAAQMVPFAAAGYAQASLLDRRARRVSALYAFDLSGATLGALAALPLLRRFSAADAIAWTALAFTLGAFVTGGRCKRGNDGSYTRYALVGIALSSLATLAFRPFDIRHAAGYSEANVVAVDWSALARIGLYDAEGKAGTLKNPLLVVDNTSASDVAFINDSRFDSNLERIPYLLRPRGDVLVIGAGGGQEIETALATAPNRRRHVDAVELADGEERLMRRLFGQRPDFLLAAPGVDYTIADGRSYLEMSARRWDVIEMKEVNFHSFAGQASSAWTPNLLFTAEGVRTELSHLTDSGLLAINRGLYGGGEVESTLQTLMTIRRAADAMRLDLSPRLVIVDRPRRVGVQRMCLVAIAPFTEDELRQIEHIANSAHLNVVRTPLSRYEPIEGILAGPYAEAVADIFSKHHLLIESTTDDRPFGYQHLPFVAAVFGRTDEASSSPHTSLQRADYRFLTAACAALIALTAGIVLFAVRRTKRDRRGLAVGMLVACCLLGTAFMLIEVVLVERVSLLLGHPTIGFVVVLTSMLLGLGIGSIVSGVVLPERRPLLAIFLSAGVVGAVSSLIALPPLLEPWLRDSLGLAARPWAMGGILLVLTLPLGFILPSLLRLAVRSQSAPAASCWSANAASSVFGTIAAALLVRTLGFNVVGQVACAMYVAALAIWLGASLITRAAP